ncbi:PQQ-binding-like beta-propeller repeat protein [Cohnella caldifontis]|uniref:outer membrane protein assembly factor BamB family protein n=1 Tax=Cohnella caldifontis TaxID=3027471 RepID=UPI0023EC480D|nr:PQQ-binding-like beta-propeller repeat protein [Cohnella sp. YIM B05605]
MKSIRSSISLILSLAAVMFLAVPTAFAENLIQYRWDKLPGPQHFPDAYSKIPGVLTFRGNASRTAPSFGTVQMADFQPKIAWSKTTRSSSWGGGAGWTGQPAIVRWPPDVLRTMNVKGKFRAKPDFTEVIYGSLDGYVYFLDLETGEETRPPIRVGNPIKGSVSVDSRGYPLLYVGEGIPENGSIGFNLYSLIDQKRLYRQQGIDSFARRGWGAFDGSALFNRTDDTLLVGGENGMLYVVELNTIYDKAKGTIRVDPKPRKYRYAIAGNARAGIENSVAVYGNAAYFADNGGSLQAVDLKTHAPIWSLPATDDTDATLVIEEENGVPYLYTGTEVDKQGKKGKALLRKINGRTGAVVWSVSYDCYSQIGDHPVNGGLLATPVVGKGEIADLAVFTLARYGSFDGGVMVALDKRTGKERWRLPMGRYAWSSPVDVYDSQGHAYLVQADSVGTIAVIDAENGKVKGSVRTGANIEASPAAFGDMLVVASRGGKIFGIRLT